MTKGIIKSGAIRSPEDKRDYTIAAAMEVSGITIPDYFEVWQPPVENQQKTQNCVAQSLANILECIEHRNNLPHTNYSVGFIYGNRPSPEQVYEGMIPRNALNTLLNDGDVYRDTWESYDEIPTVFNELQKVRPSLLTQTKKLVQSYVRLTSKEEVQLFMLKYNLPILFVADASVFSDTSSGDHAVVGYGWCDPEKHWNPKSTNKHEQALYKKKADILVTNSWGADWGLGGRTGANYYFIGEKWGLIPVEKVKFTDVPDNRWSAAAIKEAADDGIIMGYPDGTFKPAEKLSREEIAVIWQRMKRYIDGLL